MTRLRVLVAAAGALIGGGVAAQPVVGTAFTYQGSLKQNGQSLNQAADFQFRLYTAPAGGAQVGPQVAQSGVAVNNGLFSATLDFGAGAWADNTARWLEIDVRSPSGSGAFATLQNRQALLPTPFAINLRGVAVDSGGNVGIGTNAPTNRLTVAGLSDTNCIVAIDSGATAAQSSTLRLNDRGMAVWSINKNSSNDFTIRNVVTGADRLYITGLGNVGIGTSSPSNLLSVNGDSNINGHVGIGTNSPTASLDVVGGSWFVRTAGGGLRMESSLDTLHTGSPGFLIAYNGSGNQTAFIGTQSAAPARGIMGIEDPAIGGFVQAGVMWNGSAGVVFGDVKQFRVLNPRQPGTDIAYACIEGPEAAAYVRGTGHLVSGRAVVVLPEHFRDVAVSEGMTVQLTPCWAGSRGLAVTFRSTDHFEVTELLEGAGTYDFDWRVEAVRAGHEQYRVIVPSAERMAAAAGAAGASVGAAR